MEAKRNHATLQLAVYEIRRDRVILYILFVSNYSIIIKVKLIQEALVAIGFTYSLSSRILYVETLVCTCIPRLALCPAIGSIWLRWWGYKVCLLLFHKLRAFQTPPLSWSYFVTDDSRVFFSNIINAKVTLFACLLRFHAKATELILMKFSTQII